MKLNKFTTLLSLALTMAIAVGCSDDNNPTPLDKSEMSIENTTCYTLTFEWGKVADACQYSYKFTNTATGDIIVTDVTNRTKVTFTDLQPSTDYTLTVLAYAAVGSDRTTSEPLVLTARTADLEPIASPVPEMSRELNTVIFSWQHIDSSTSYQWSLVDEEGTEIASGETRALNAEVAGMQSGTYTFSVIALIDQPGLKDSEPAILEFDFVREREEIWRTSGTYTSALSGSDWTSILVAYDDNSYTIEAWYGVEGYDLTFTVDADNMLTLSDTDYAYDSTTGTYTVPTGLATPANVNVTTADNQSSFEGGAGKGSITIRVSDGTHTDNDTFQWRPTIDDFCGEWILYTCNKDAYNSSLTEDITTISITKIDENTLSIPLHIFYQGIRNFTAKAIVDIDAMTFSIAPVNVVSSFVFASYSDANAPVTGTISPVKFSISNWDVWYGTYYGYGDEGKMELSRP